MLGDQQALDQLGLLARSLHGPVQSFGFQLGVTPTMKHGWMAPTQYLRNCRAASGMLARR
jgi:hypothetical protein